MLLLNYAKLKKFDHRGELDTVLKILKECASDPDCHFMTYGVIVNSLAHKNISITNIGSTLDKLKEDGYIEEITLDFHTPSETGKMELTHHINYKIKQKGLIFVNDGGYKREKKLNDKERFPKTNWWITHLGALCVGVISTIFVQWLLPKLSPKIDQTAPIIQQNKDTTRFK